MYSTRNVLMVYCSFYIYEISVQYVLHLVGITERTICANSFIFMEFMAIINGSAPINERNFCVSCHSVALMCAALVMCISTTVFFDR